MTRSLQLAGLLGAALPAAAGAGVLPPDPAETGPLAPRIAAFLANQAAVRDDRPTGLVREDYLRVIAGQVRVFRGHQDADGRILDPVRSNECYFATPCHAHAVAALAAGGMASEPGVLESGLLAMDSATRDMAAGTAAGGHGDFFTWPVMLALPLYDGIAPPARAAEWTNRLARIDPAKLYRVRTDANNWNLVNVAGEFLRGRAGMTPPDYVEACLGAQRKHFTDLGMFNEAGNPLPYDLFSRHYLAGMLHLGYDGAHAADYRGLLGRGAWMSLFLQSPSGEMPTGFRSSHHIWNEAQQAVLFEIYAAHLGAAGRAAEAGAFKRAARMSLAAVKQWIRPDGSGFVVKNRFPEAAQHGYETYTTHSAYNLLACSMLAQAWKFADDKVAERPAPAEVGGFAVPVLDPFHKVFANAGGTQIEIETAGDRGARQYNPLGLIRVHVQGGHPQLGPSDGCAPYISGAGVNRSVAPAWRRPDGAWVRLADLRPGRAPEVEVLREAPHEVAVRVSHGDLPAGTGGVVRLISTYTVRRDGVTVEESIAGDVDAMRVEWPMLVFDGRTRTGVRLEGSAVEARLDGRGVRFAVLEPAGVVLRREGREVPHRNGTIDTVLGEAGTRRIVWSLTAAAQRGSHP
ncbi:MAG: hypothetical protein FJ221_14370 [Lentisphaerae bacterium]|nr:hypothetical protein [Lentisphaerota bacterium]